MPLLDYVLVRVYFLLVRPISKQMLPEFPHDFVWKFLYNPFN